MEKVEYKYIATIVRVIDGDTVVFDIDLGFRATIRIPVRLYGIDTPELNAKTGAGYEAKKYIADHCPVGSSFILQSHKNEFDKYGRWLGTIIVGDSTINQQLIDLALAKPYFGGTK